MCFTRSKKGNSPKMCLFMLCTSLELKRGTYKRYLGHESDILQRTCHMMVMRYEHIVCIPQSCSFQEDLPNLPLKVNSGKSEMRRNPLTGLYSDTEFSDLICRLYFPAFMLGSIDLLCSRDLLGSRDFFYSVTKSGKE